MRVFLIILNSLGFFLIFASLCLAEKGIKKKVAVIGGGTGLQAAWAIDASGQFEVSLFEAADRLGGNVVTEIIDNIAVDLGPEFVGANTPSGYRDMHILLNHLGIQLFPEKFSFCLKYSDGDNLGYPLSEMTTRFVDRLAYLLFHQESSHALKLHLADFFDLSILQHMPVSPTKTLLDLENDFTSHLENLPIFEKIWLQISGVPYHRNFFKNVLYPIIAAGWGTKIDDAKQFLQNYSLSYLQLPQEWYSVKDGYQSYFGALIKKLSRHTQIITDTKILQIVPLANKKFRLSLQNRSRTFNLDNFDTVIIATPPRETHSLLEALSQVDPKFDRLRKKLEKIKTFDSTVVIFKDDPAYLKNYTCPEPYLVNSFYDAEQDLVFQTFNSPHRMPFKKTWLLGQDLPQGIRKTRQFVHYHMDLAYFEGYQEVTSLQGYRGIFYGGAFAGFNDSHESALRTNLKIAKMIVSQAGDYSKNPVLKLFPALMHELNNKN